MDVLRPNALEQIYAHASRSFAALAQATPLARRQHALYRGGRSY